LRERQLVQELTPEAKYFHFNTHFKQQPVDATIKIEAGVQETVPEEEDNSKPPSVSGRSHIRILAQPHRSYKIYTITKGTVPSASAGGTEDIDGES
jgi:hypothetical protein